VATDRNAELPLPVVALGVVMDRRSRPAFGARRPAFSGSARRGYLVRISDMWGWSSRGSVGVTNEVGPRPWSPTVQRQAGDPGLPWHACGASARSSAPL